MFMKQQLSQLIGVPFYSLQSRDLTNDCYQLSFFVDRKYLGKFARMPYARVTFRNDAIWDRCNKIWIKLHVEANTDSLSLIPEPNGKMTKG